MLCTPAAALHATKPRTSCGKTRARLLTGPRCARCAVLCCAARAEPHSDEYYAFDLEGCMRKHGLKDVETMEVRGLQFSAVNAQKMC